FSGKAIYQPTGKAAEYSPWACNFFTGCSNDCEYCYCKRGVMSHVWNTRPQLKKCFKDEEHAYAIFKKELLDNIDALRKSGLLFSFTTDPLLPETKYLTYYAIQTATENGVPVKVLTKRSDFIEDIKFLHLERELIAFGFTLTGCDDKEPGASSNYERIEAMHELHKMGFKTFASIEPVIVPAMSMNMMIATRGFCDLYKVGLISGKGKGFYNEKHLQVCYEWLEKESYSQKIYLKDSFITYLGIQRENLPGEFVNSDYNIFHQ
ncbi:MAG: hypothetical protein K2H85_05455, partial [Allobaculum sp.]|nr:hypothetical protein [Allobaculum sp.]